MARVYYERGGYYIDHDAVIPGAVLTAATAADLRTQSPVGSTPIRYTEGRLAPGDGDGGFWTWNPTSVVLDNGANVISNPSFPVGRWTKERITGSVVISVKDFGAVGDGIVDDTPAIAAAVSYRRSLGYGDIYFPVPPARYIFRPQGYSYGSRYPTWSGCIDIDFGDVTLFGDPGGTRLALQTPGGGNPDTSFALTAPWADDNLSHSPVPYASRLPSHFYNMGELVSGPNGHAYVATVSASTGTGSGPADLNPITCGAITDGAQIWALADACFRGNPFRIKSFATGATVPIGNIVFRDLIFDGGAPRQEAIWPMVASPVPLNAAPYVRSGAGYGGVDVPAGAGWPTPFGHMPVSMPTPYSYGDITFERCGFTGWRSETIYATHGNTASGLLHMADCWIDDCGADGISFTGKGLFENITITNTPQAIENDPGQFDQTFRGLDISDCGWGLILPSNVASYTARGKTLVEDFSLERITRGGISITGFTSNVRLHRGRIIDAANAGGFQALGVVGDATGVAGRPTNIEIDDVVVGTAQRATDSGFYFFNARGTMRVKACRIWKKEGGPGAVTAAFGGNVMAGDSLHMDNCDYRGALGQGSIGGPGNVRISNSRVDGLFLDEFSLVPLATTFDAQCFDYYEFKPVGARTLATPSNFPVGLEVMCVINGNVTIKNNANIVLLAGVDYAPGATAAIWFTRSSLASNKIVQTRAGVLL